MASSVTTVRVEDGAGNSYNLLEADGMLFPEYFTSDPAQRLTDIRDMPGRDDDVIICAFPKAGTHWLWEITDMLLRGSAEYHSAMKEAQMMELAGPESASELPSPRVFNTHFTWRYLPKDMISRNCKMIYIVRNPKDMAVSRYGHVIKGSTAYKGTFSDYLPIYMDGKIAFGSWFDYTIAWNKDMQENKDYPIITMCYEEMKKDPVAQVKRLAEFLHARSDDEFIEAVCQKCDFKNLKTSYAKTKQAYGENEANPTTYSFRKGEVGDWKNWFTVTQSEQFDQMIDKKLAGYNHEFIYELSN